MKGGKSSIGNRGLEKSTPKVNENDFKVLTYVWDSEEHEAFSDMIMNKFNVSRQLISRRMKKLTSMGLIEKVLRSHANLYRSAKNPRDIDVNIFSAGVRNRHIRTHSIGCAFEVIKDNPNFHLKRRYQMKNWVKEVGIFNGCMIAKHPKKIIIYPGEMKGSNAHENTSALQHRADITMQKLADRYLLTYRFIGLIQKPHHAIVTKPLTKFSEKYIQANGNITTPEGMIDDSMNVGGEVEVFDEDDATNVLSMGKNLTYIRQMVTVLAESQKKQADEMATYSEHLNAHIPVLLELAPALREFKHLARPMKRWMNRLNQKSLKEFVRA
jgi:hypothetical protein